MQNLVQNHKCNEVKNAFPIFKVSHLVRVHTDSHHNGHNKMIFAVSQTLILKCQFLKLINQRAKFEVCIFSRSRDIRLSLIHI